RPSVNKQAGLTQVGSNRLVELGNLFRGSRPIARRSCLRSPPPPFHRVEPIQFSLRPGVEPFHHLATYPADGELATDLPRARKGWIAPHQVVDRLPGTPAKDR